MNNSTSINVLPGQTSGTVTVVSGLTEEHVNAKVQEATKKLTEDFAKDLEKKITEAKEQAKKALESDPAVAFSKFALEDIAKTLSPFLLPKDIQDSIKAKDVVIEGLNKEIEALKKSLIESDAKALKSARVAHRIGLVHHFSSLIAESKEKEAIKKLVGDITRFTKFSEVTEAVSGAKAAIRSLVEDKTGFAEKEKTIRAEYEAKLTEAKKVSEKALAESEKAKKDSKELSVLTRQYGLKAYVMEKTRNNPNGPKIIKLAEGLQTKEQADSLIAKFSVEAPELREYNSIRQRFSRLEKTNLVEAHLKETGLKKSTQKEVVEGVESEMVDLFPGSSLEQVRDLGLVD